MGNKGGGEVVEIGGGQGREKVSGEREKVGREQTGRAKGCETGSWRGKVERAGGGGWGGGGG